MKYPPSEASCGARPDCSAKFKAVGKLFLSNSSRMDTGPPPGGRGGPPGGGGGGGGPGGGGGAAGPARSASRREGARGEGGQVEPWREGGDVEAGRDACGVEAGREAGELGAAPEEAARVELQASLRRPRHQLEIYIWEMTEFSAFGEKSHRKVPSRDGDEIRRYQFCRRHPWRHWKLTTGSFGQLQGIFMHEGKGRR